MQTNKICIVNTEYGNVMTMLLNVKYKDMFLRAFKEAMERKRSLWEE